MKNPPAAIIVFPHATRILCRLFPLFAGLATHAVLQAAPVAGLRCESQAGWMVTDDPDPQLSWQPVAGDGAPVSGYEVATAGTLDEIEKDGGKSAIVPVSDGPHMIFKAESLPSRTEIWWRVRPVLKSGAPDGWSAPAVFETGLKTADWKADWIAMPAKDRQHSAPQFRKAFQIDKPVLKARFYVCGQGWHESWLNGAKLGDEVLQPAQTDYDQRNFYVSHDVTSQVKQGENVLGVWLGDGFFNQDRVWGPQGMSYGEPRWMGQLEISHPDGSVTVIVSDPTWTCGRSPITASNVYAGETYDARAENPGWSRPGAATEGCVSAVKSADPGGVLVAQPLPPCRRLGTVKVRAVRESKPGTWIYDFGVNLVGWAKIQVEAEPGTRLTVRFAEDILPDGSLNFATGGVEHTKVIQTDDYTCRGGGRETWEPRFTYHGFRYAELTLSGGSLKSGAPGKDLLEGVIVHNDLPVIGNFQCSDATLNTAFEFANRSFVGSIQGTPTDCPIRERCGWTGDAHLIVPFSMYRFDASTLWRKYIGDIVTTARRATPMLVFGKGMDERTVKPKAAGIPTMVAPGKRFIGEASPDWGSALAFIPWDLYLATGDLRPLQRHYDSMKQWTLHLESRATDGILLSGLGDWCKPGTGLEGSPSKYYGQVVPMLSTACYFRCARILADTAKLLGHDEDAERFEKLTQSVRAAFVREFYGPEPSMVPDQTIQAIAVQWGVLPRERQQEAANQLAELVTKAGYHFATGVFGSPSLWPVLVTSGHQEVAWKALQNETSPSLKYLIKRGATTFWEVWPEESDVAEVYSRSENHPFQAGFVSWFFSGLAGIRPDAKDPGFRTILLEPQMIDGLDWVKCEFASPMGGIESSWKRDGKSLRWEITIPQGAQAHVRVPGRIKELKSAGSPPSFSDADDDQGKAQRLTLGPGKFVLTSDLP